MAQSRGDGQPSYASRTQLVGIGLCTGPSSYHLSSIVTDKTQRFINVVEIPLAGEHVSILEVERHIKAVIF